MSDSFEFTLITPGFGRSGHENLSVHGGLKHADFVQKIEDFLQKAKAGSSVLSIAFPILSEIAFQRLLWRMFLS
jgi:hypothetical protein